jgi:hypothetical protein
MASLVTDVNREGHEGTKRWWMPTRARCAGLPDRAKGLEYKPPLSR